MRRIRMIIEYDGTNYSGWQRQLNAPSVQETVENALRRLTGERELFIVGASRTDAGVHAAGQNAHFDTECRVPADKFAFALNTMLPPDVRVRASMPAAEDFHARFSAKGKEYRYLFYNSPHASAMYRSLTAHVMYPLDAEKMDRAQKMLIGTEYEGAKDEIAGDVDEALAVLTNEIMARQHRAADVFVRMLRTIIVCVVIFAVMMLLASLVIRRGVQELQTLAETYNSIYAENEEREMLMKHQAEHDPLTELLNRRSFDRILDLYTKDKNSFALILSDVDTFKSVNDTYGHDVGDVILKKAASLQQSTFRSVDYVCRIGGDEFAVIMVDMTRELYYTITDKIAEINRQLAICEEGLPAVSLSAGVAFSDEDGQKESLFKAADHALYYTKKHGRSGCNVSPVA